MDEYYREQCPVCGCEMEWEPCWQCFGEGGFHDCGEDSCCCLEPELNIPCDVCDWEGEYPVCPRAGETNHRREVDG